MAGPIGSSQWSYSSGGASNFYDYQIEQSARFDDGGGGTNTATRLYRTFGTVTSQTTFTMSVWVKRSETYEGGGNTAWQQIICRGTGVEGGGSAFGFESGNDKILKAFGKGGRATIDQAGKAVQIGGRPMFRWESCLFYFA